MASPASEGLEPGAIALRVVPPTELGTGSPRLAAVLELYRQSFPPEEREPEAILCDCLQTGQERLLAALAGESVRGIAVLWPLADSDATLLDYFAVDPALRGQGLGSRLLQAVWQDCRDRGRVLLLEVEDPAAVAAAGDRQLAERRIAFYRRAGARVLAGVPYRLPRLDGSDGPATAMQVMLLGAGEVSALAGDRVRRWIAQIYRELRDLGPDCELVRPVLAAIGDRVALK